MASGPKKDIDTQRTALKSQTTTASTTIFDKAKNGIYQQTHNQLSSPQIHTAPPLRLSVTPHLIDLSYASSTLSHQL